MEPTHSQNSVIKSFPCPFHPTEQIERVCLSSESKYSLQCFECILKTKANFPQAQFSSLADFITTAAQYYKANNRRPTLPEDPPSELVDFLVYEEIKTKALANHIEREKLRVEKNFDLIIQNVIQLCQTKKEEIFNKLDQQLSLLKQNYAEYKRRVNKHFPKEREDNGIFNAQSIITKINKCRDASEMEMFTRDIKEDISQSITENFSPKVELQNFSYELNKQANLAPRSILNNQEFFNKSIQKITTIIEDFDHIQDPMIDIYGSKLSFDSKIITKPQDTALIKRWLSPFGKYVTLELLYRGSRDGFDPKIFHAKCDRYYSTLTIAKSKQKKIFGGFSDEPWILPIGSYAYNYSASFVKSENCWLFSLDHQEKYPVKRYKEAIRAHDAYGPTFGSVSHDLYLNLSANGTGCTSTLGTSYECDWLDADQKFTRLAGARDFTLKEIEVFAVFGRAPVLKDSKFDSKILDIGHLKLIQDWTINMGKNSKGNNIELALIYRGSRDGFDAKAFHNYCDNQGPTLVVCKSAEHYKVFGGYTSQNWSRANKFVADNSAFLFSITNKTKHIIQDNEKAIFCNGEAGPIFGEGHDLFIAADSDKNEDSKSEFGVTYKARESLGDLGEYLAGAAEFRLEEIEVFRVITSFKFNPKTNGFARDI